MSRRSDQVAAMMQQELGLLLLGMEFPAMTTISKVEVTSDLKHSKVWITVLSEDQRVEKEVLELLKSNLYEMQGELNRKFTMYQTPRITFLIDNSLHYASRINHLIKSTHEDDEKQS